MRRHRRARNRPQHIPRRRNIRFPRDLEPDPEPNPEPNLDPDPIPALDEELQHMDLPNGYIPQMLHRQMLLEELRQTIFDVLSINTFIVLATVCAAMNPPLNYKDLNFDMFAFVLKTTLGNFSRTMSLLINLISFVPIMKPESKYHILIAMSVVWNAGFFVVTFYRIIYALDPVANFLNDICFSLLLCGIGVVVLVADFKSLRTMLYIYYELCEIS